MGPKMANGVWKGVYPGVLGDPVNFRKISCLISCSMRKGCCEGKKNKRKEKNGENCSPLTSTAWTTMPTTRANLILQNLWICPGNSHYLLCRNAALLILAEHPECLLVPSLQVHVLAHFLHYKAKLLKLMTFCLVFHYIHIYCGSFKVYIKM